MKVTLLCCCFWMCTIHCQRNSTAPVCILIWTFALIKINQTKQSELVNLAECVLPPSFGHPKFQHGVVLYFALALIRVYDAFQVPVECSWTIQINQIADIYASAFSRLYNTYKPQKKVTASKNSRHLAVSKSQFQVSYVPYCCFSTRWHCELEVCYATVNWKCVRQLSPDHLWHYNTIT